MFDKASVLRLHKQMKSSQGTPVMKCSRVKLWLQCLVALASAQRDRLSPFLYLLHFPSLLFTLALPCRLVAAADALLGMVHVDLLLPLLPLTAFLACSAQLFQH
jgi:hypothetical protein